MVKTLKSAGSQSGTSSQRSGAETRASGNGRLAACWFSSGVFTLDVNLTDGGAHQVALYLLNWEAAARSERIDVLDAGTGTVLDTRTVSGFSGGQYLVWTLSGHVTLRVTNLGSPNAVVSGIFFDALPAAAPTVSLTSPLDSTQANLPFDANGNLVATRSQPKNAGFGVANAYQNPRTLQAQIRFSF